MRQSLEQNRLNLASGANAPLHSSQRPPFAARCAARRRRAFSRARVRSRSSLARAASDVPPGAPWGSPGDAAPFAPTREGSGGVARSWAASSAPGSGSPARSLVDPGSGDSTPPPASGSGGYLSPQPRPSLAGVGAAVVSVAQLARPPLQCLAGGQRKLARRRGTIAAMGLWPPPPRRTPEPPPPPPAGRWSAAGPDSARRTRAPAHAAGRASRASSSRIRTSCARALSNSPAHREACRRSRLPGPDADRLASEHLPQGGRLMPTAFVPGSGRFCHHLLTRMRSLERLAPRSDRARKASSASGGPLLTSAGRSKGGCWRANGRHEATTAPPRSCGRDSNRMRRGQQLACRLLAENHAAVRIAEPIGRVRLAAAPIRSIRSGPLSPAPCPRDSPEAAAGRNRAQPWPSPPPFWPPARGPRVAALAASRQRRAGGI